MYTSWIEPNLFNDRIDANFYAPEFLSIEKAIHNSKWKSGPLGKSLKKVFKGAFYVLASEYVEEGYPFIRVSDITSGFVNLSKAAYLNEEVFEREKKTMVLPGYLLFAKGGSIGNCAVVPKSILKANISQDIIGLIPKDTIDPYYIQAFFKSVYGVRQMVRWVQGNVHPHITNQAVKNINILLPSNITQQSIGNKIRKAERLRELSKKSLIKAQKLLDEIIRPYIRPPEYPIIKSKSIDSPRDSYFKKFIPADNLNDRLTPQQYRPDILFAEKTMGLMPNVESLGRMVTAKIAQGPTPKYASSGVSCLKTKNVEGIFVSTEQTDFVSESYVLENPRSVISPNTIVLNRQGAGSIGRSGVYLGEDSICINDSLFRISLKNEYDPAFVVLFLNSWFGERQIEKGINGSTGQLTLGQSHLNHILIPCPDSEQQILIGDYVRNSFSMNNEAKQLIEKAKFSIDSLIKGTYDEESMRKQNEEIERWLKDNPSPTTSGRNT